MENAQIFHINICYKREVSRLSIIKMHLLSATNTAATKLSKMYT